MGSFFGGLFRGIIVTFLGTAAVYLAFFAMMSPKLPKDPAGAKAFISDLFNVKATFGKLQTKSVDYLDKNEVRAALDEEWIAPDAKIIEPTTEKISPEEFNQLRLENAELKKEIKRLKAAFAAIPRTISVPEEPSTPTIEFRN